MNLWYRTTWTSILGQIPSLENWSNWPLCGRRIQLRWWPLYKLSTGLHRKTSRPTKTCEPSAPLQFILPPYREFVALLHLLLPRQQSKLKLGRIALPLACTPLAKPKFDTQSPSEFPCLIARYIFTIIHLNLLPICSPRTLQTVYQQKKIVGRRSMQVIIRNHNIMYHIVS